MKYLKIFLLMISLTNLSWGQSQNANIAKEHSDLSSLNLKGAIKQVKEISFRGAKQGDTFVAISPEWQYSWQNDKLYTFDLDGNLTHEIFYNGETEIRRNTYKFDSNGIIEARTRYHDRFYQYNSQGQIETVRVINKQPAIITTGNEPDAEGQTSIRYYEYDERGRLKKVIERDLSGNQLHYEMYNYNSAGLLREKQLNYPDFTDTYIYKYNNLNLPTEIVWRDSEEGILEIERFNYQNGELIEVKWENFDENELEGYIVYTFENGNKKQILEYDSENELEGKQINIYKYDLHGNWTRKVIITDNDKVFIVQREIEYY